MGELPLFTELPRRGVPGNLELPVYGVLGNSEGKRKGRGKDPRPLELLSMEWERADYCYYCCEGAFLAQSGS